MGVFGENHGRYFAVFEPQPQRRTLGFFGPVVPPLLPSFRRACRYRPEALHLMYRELRRREFPVPDELFRCEYDLYNGDLLEGGRGEILLRAKG